MNSKFTDLKLRVTLFSSRYKKRCDAASPFIFIAFLIFLAISSYICTSSLDRSWNGALSGRTFAAGDGAIPLQTLLFISTPQTPAVLIENIGNKSGIAWGKYMFEREASLQLIERELCSKLNICGVKSLETVPTSDLLNLFDLQFSSEKKKKHAHKKDHNKYALSLLKDTYSRLFDLENINYFCIVRDPKQRMLQQFNEYAIHKSKEFPSVYKSKMIDACSAQDLNVYIHNILQKELNNYCLENCHFVPHFRYAYTSKHKKNEQICKYILYFDDQNLDDFVEQFNNLMEQNKLDIKLTHEILLKSEVLQRKCDNLTIHDFDNKVSKLIKDHFSKDYATFDFKKRSPQI